MHVCMYANIYVSSDSGTHTLFGALQYFSVGNISRENLHKESKLK